MSLEDQLRGPRLSSFVHTAQGAGEGAIRVPVVRTLPADLLTPVSAWLRLRDRSSHTFLFESVEGGEHLARYSFVGFRPSMLIRSWGHHVEVEHRGRTDERTVELHSGDPRDVLRALVRRAPLVPAPGLPRFLGGAVGFFGYDSVRLIEDIPRNNPDALGTPDLNLAVHDQLVAFDHLRAVVHLVCIVEVPPSSTDEALTAQYDDAIEQLDAMEQALAAPLPPRPPRASGEPPELRSNETKAAFAAKVERAQEHIRAGDIFQVVLSQRLSGELVADPFEVYRAVRVLNPSPYLFFLQMGDHTLVGASPELLVRVEGDLVETMPIAGTRARGATEAEDRALEAELVADPKERAEHEMLVDLGRNDIGRVSRFGTVEVTEHASVQRFSHVMHLVSRVQGRLREDVDALDALYACFPAGTVSGAPKVRAMEIIEDLERTARGVYAGAVGYLDYRGDLDTCIAIRTVVVAGREAHVQAGAGIVYDSVPAKEYIETINKAGALVDALRWAETGVLG